MMTRNNKMKFTLYMLTLTTLALNILAPHSARSAPKAECVELTPLYLQSVAQLRSTQDAFISTACNEHPESADCKRLTLSGQELMSTLQMLTLKMKASECDPTAPAQRALNSCERLQQMIKNADQKLTELKSQARAQRCQVRANSPACRALKKARMTPLNIIRAAEKKWARQGCSTPQGEDKELGGSKTRSSGSTSSPSPK